MEAKVRKLLQCQDLRIIKRNAAISAGQVPSRGRRYKMLDSVMPNTYVSHKP
ncbi:hypothetical protein PY364_28695 [Kamptonema sp. UHCC 0994]|nr:hypothetical protein [Kamptonema sp. UHCC 0994]